MSKKEIWLIVSLMLFVISLGSASRVAEINSINDLISWGTSNHEIDFIVRVSFYSLLSTLVLTCVILKDKVFSRNSQFSQFIKEMREYK